MAKKYKDNTRVLLRFGVLFFCLFFFVWVLVFRLVELELGNTNFFLPTGDDLARRARVLCLHFSSLSAKRGTRNQQPPEVGGGEHATRP